MNTKLDRYVHTNSIGGNFKKDCFKQPRCPESSMTAFKLRTGIQSINLGGWGAYGNENVLKE